MAKKELTTAEKMKALYNLQKIDSQIDKIQTLKGELPMEVEDLEDEIVGLQTRLDNLELELEDLNKNLAERENSIKESNALIEKYEKQMDNVKNSREFDALTKEVGMQKLEIQLAEKKIREAKLNLENKVEIFEKSKAALETRKVELEDKKKELEQITKETDKEEKDLLKKSDTAKKDIEEGLLKAYNRIRKNYRNGLAVVSVERSACGGCHAVIPPQVQIDIDEEKRMIICEHCGRILVPEYEGAEAK